MNDRERFVAAMTGQPVDRPPYLLFWGPWGTTWERWEREGKPAYVRDQRAVFNPDQLPLVVPVSTGPTPAHSHTILEEDDEFVISLDSWGIKRRDFKGHTSMSEFLEFPVKNWEDWKRYKEERLNPDDPERLAGNWREQADEWARQGYPIQIGGYPDTTTYGAVRWLLGDEECLLAFYTQPDLVRDIMDHVTTVNLAVFEQVVKHVQPDVLHIWEDMCGKQGSLISPQHWEEFMGPCYRRYREFARAHHIPIISVDTDGDPDKITPVMMRNGVNMLLPLEVAGGCDVNVWRRKYPDLAILGGIDKRALAEGPEAIDKELERVRPAVEMGRYIPDLDHLIPDDVSWENYCYYARALRRLVGKD